MGKKVKSDFMITAVMTEGQTPNSARIIDRTVQHSITQRSATHRRNVTQESELSSKTLVGVGLKEATTKLKRISFAPAAESLPHEDFGSRPELGVAQLFANIQKQQEQTQSSEHSTEHKARLRKSRGQSKSEHFSRGPIVGLSVPNLPMFEYYHVERKLRNLETNSPLKLGKTSSWKLKLDKVQDQSLTTAEQELLAASPSNTSHTILSLVRATNAGYPGQNRYDDSNPSGKESDGRIRKAPMIATRFGPGLTKYKNSRSVMNFQIKLTEPNRVRNVQLANMDTPHDSDDPSRVMGDSKPKSLLSVTQNPSGDPYHRRQNSFQAELERANLEEQYKLRQAHEKETPKMKVLSSLQHLRDLLKCLKELYIIYINPNVSEEQYLIKVGSKLDEQIHLGLPSDSPLKGLFLKPDKTAFPSEYFTLSRLFKMIIKPNLLVEKFRPYWRQAGSSNQLSQFVTPVKMASLKKGHTIEVQMRPLQLNSESASKNYRGGGLSKSNLDSYQDVATHLHLRQPKVVSFAEFDLSPLDASREKKRKEKATNQSISQNIKFKGSGKDSRLLQSFSQDRILHQSGRLDTSHLNNSKSNAQEEKICPPHCEACSSLGGDRTFCNWLNGLDDHSLLDEILEHAANIEIDHSLLNLLTKLVQNLTANLSAHHSSMAAAQGAALTHRLSSIRKLTATSLASTKRGLVVAGAVALEEPLSSTARSLRRGELDLQRREDEVVHETGARLHVWTGARERLKTVKEV
jgi:hypothetical protein